MPTSAGLAEAADDFLDDVVGGFYDPGESGVADFDRPQALFSATEDPCSASGRPDRWISPTR